MSKINYILGGDSITVFLDGNSYTINKQAPTYEMVLTAVRNNDVDALRNAVDIRKNVVQSFVDTGNSLVTITSDSGLYYGDYEITGLIATRIFDVLEAGLSATPMVRFIENLMKNPSKRAVDELYGFIDACRLPITEDGYFLAYKRVNENYTDVYTGKIDNSVGATPSMPRNMVNDDKEQTCSQGLHFCSYGYLQHYGGERIMVVKVNPADVVSIPVDYDNAKGRACRYEVVDEIPANEYQMPTYTIKDGYSPDYGYVNQDDAPENDGAISDDFIQEEIDFLTDDEVRDIVQAYRDNESVTHIAMDYGISRETVEHILHENNVDNRTGNNGNSTKLTITDVNKIRADLAMGDSLASIGRKYGVHPRTIGRIRDGEAWVNV
jgi:hypothetical protein